MAEIEDMRKNSASDKIKRGFAKFKSAKNIQIIAVIFIIAICLIIYSSVTTSKAASAQDSVMTSDEKRLSAILSEIDGAGEVQTMITSSDGKTVGVIIIAEGARDITVRLRLMDAAACALGVSKDIVSVFTRK